MERYHRKGLDRVTRALLESVRAVMRDSRSLLDVGGGVGVLSFELLGAGLTEATLVDGSPAYVEAAGREAERLGHSTRMHLVTGDFTAVADRLEPADVVTMHRVVCCFPRYDALIGAATARCRQVFAFSYPADRWYIRAWVRLDNLRRRIFRNPFQTFVHPPPEMHAILERSGFARLSHKRTAVWCVDVYRRTVAG
jgi:2-polyprenyl-3-methyl-5-hydroxy-6-metoxy-1,4-benzoquinol methylase